MTTMTNAPTRYCHPCKGEGNRVPAGLNRAGNAYNRRARVNGTMANVCDMHGDALDVVRATVSGQGQDVRQANEGAIFVQGAALAERKGDLTAARANVMGLLTQPHLSKMLRVAQSKGWTAAHADSLFDAMLDAAIKRLGDRAFNGQPLDVDFVIHSALKANEAGASERLRAREVRLDTPSRYTKSDSVTYGDDLENEGMVVDGNDGHNAWRVGGMTVGVTDLRGLLDGGCPNGISAEDWAYLLDAYGDDDDNA